MKKYIKVLIRTIISLTFIIFLLKKVQLDELKEILIESEWILYTISTCVVLSTRIFAAFRWKYLLSVFKLKISLLRIMYWGMIATFFNMFLPTALGGDVVRIYELSKHSGRTYDAAASVLIGRIIGYVGAIALAFGALVFNPVLRGDSRILVSVVTITVASLSAMFVLFNTRLSKKVVQIFSRLGMGFISEKVEKAYEALHLYRGQYRVLIVALLMSLFLQVTYIACVYLIGIALGMEVPFRFYLSSIPLIWIITMIPVSISGIGLREGGFVFFFSMIGVKSEKSIALSLLVFSQMVLIGLIGGIMYLSFPLVEKKQLKNQINDTIQNKEQ